MSVDGDEEMPMISERDGGIKPLETDVEEEETHGRRRAPFGNKPSGLWITHDRSTPSSANQPSCVRRR